MTETETRIARIEQQELPSERVVPFPLGIVDARLMILFANMMLQQGGRVRRNHLTQGSVNYQIFDPDSPETLVGGLLLTMAGLERTHIEAHLVPPAENSDPVVETQNRRALNYMLHGIVNNIYTHMEQLNILAAQEQEYQSRASAAFNDEPLDQVITRIVRPTKTGPTQDTLIKIEKLRELRKKPRNIRGGWNRACDIVGIEHRTAAKHAPDLKKRWNDPD